MSGVISGRKEQGTAEGKRTLFTWDGREGGVSELQAESRWEPGVQSRRGGSAGSGLGARGLAGRVGDVARPASRGLGAAALRLPEVQGVEGGGEGTNTQSSRKAVGWTF